MKTLLTKFNTAYGEMGKRERILLVVTFFCVILVILDQIILGPILGQMNTLNAEIKGKAQTIKRNLRILSFRDSILQEYSDYTTYLDSGDRSEEEIIADLLRKIETLANQNDITISNITPGEVEEKAIIREYKTSIESTGRIGDLLRFMHLLEESDYLFQILKYTFIPKSKGSEVIKCNMIISRSLVAAESIGVT